MPMASRSFQSLGPHGFHRIAYTEWSEKPEAPVMICVHGLTRNGRDFDTLAAALSEGWRIVCPDVVGRGESEYLTVKEDYNYAVYANDMAALIARSGADSVDWVGTSMGGIIGMMLAAMPGSPIRRLVLNDIGARIDEEGLKRIGGYAGGDPSFPDFDTGYRAIRDIAAAFGPMTEEQWRQFAAVVLKERPDGTWGMNYDPAIAWQMKLEPLRTIEMWHLWDAIRCPVMVLRGAESDLLSAATVEEMRTRGPGCEEVVIEGVGHTPALMDDHQVGAIRDFLSG